MTATRQYSFDHDLNVWVTPLHSGIPYSDGDAVESRLLDIVKSCNDVSGASEELQESITDWPSDYHLSSARHNLLRSFNFRPTDRILELGCGCGAMTRYLGESGATVVAVEGSLQRATIAAERCRNLPNVSVYCDNLIDLQSELLFDFVTLIGVLEYAPCYVREMDPIAACLKQARSFLKTDGVLVLAIENQFGLKYFNGRAEDHVGSPYYGLHGLYREDEPTTLGRAALEGKLGVAGLTHHQFFYPFPDYKLPQVILSDTAFSTPGFDAAALLAGMVSGNAEGEFRPNFHENLAWRPIIDNGLLPQLTNSFLIFASASSDALRKFQTDSLAYAYATNRAPAFATETRFYRSSDDLVVEKRSLHPDLSRSGIEISAGKLLHRVNTVSDYVIGFPYLVELQQRLAHGEGVSSVIEWSAPWFEVLLAHSSPNESGDASLPGDWIDSIPQNYIRATDGDLRRIDQEWALERSVPLEWVVVRGLSNSISLSPTSPALAEVRLRELIVKVASAHGICVGDEHIVDAIQRESQLRTLIYGGSDTENLEMLTAAVSGYCRCHLDDFLFNEFATNSIVRLGKEIARVKSTFSWQVTKPLRLLAAIWRALSGRSWKA